MIRSILLLGIGILMCNPLLAQKNNPFLKYAVTDTSLYGAMHEVWLSQDEINYATLFTNSVTPLGDRRVALRDGEGKDGYLLTANMALRFMIFMGRPSDRAILRRMRLTLDFKTNFRMTLDESKPLTPSGNDVGLGFDFTFYDNRHTWSWKDRSRYNQEPMATTGTTFFSSLRTQLHHYSNGQPAGFYYVEGEEQRNDYLDGDFSTNYIRSLLFGSWIRNETHQLINVGAGIRADWGLGAGGLVYSKEQEKTYGKLRLEFQADWYSGPLFADDNLRELHIRLEGGVILDNLDDFQSNLTDDSKKHRLNAHLFLEYRPLTSRSIGYFAHFYAGRDYLNIRYDDIVFIAAAGFTFSLNKYYPVGWRQRNLGGFK